MAAGIDTAYVRYDLEVTHRQLGRSSPLLRVKSVPYVNHLSGERGVPSLPLPENRVCVCNQNIGIPEHRALQALVDLRRDRTEVLSVRQSAGWRADHWIPEI